MLVVLRMLQQRPTPGTRTYRTGELVIGRWIGEKIPTPPSVHLLRATGELLPHRVIDIDQTLAFLRQTQAVATERVAHAAAPALRVTARSRRRRR